MKTIADFPLAGKRVLIRVDFNVPLTKEGNVADLTRIKSALPTIEYALSHKAHVVLLSHLGRPDGKVVPSLSLAPCAKALSDLLHQKVELVKEGAPKTSLALLENLRFHPGEEDVAKEPSFVRYLASLGDICINDAFGTAHRSHASTAEIARFFPQARGIGFLVEKELNALLPLLKNPIRPFFLILGGAKISSKAGLIANLLDKVDALFVGGAMSIPFLDASSPDRAVAQKIMAGAKKAIHLPVDRVVASALQERAPHQTLSAKEAIPAGLQQVDIGMKTIDEWKPLLAKAKTIFWNGPLGAFEFPPFDAATKELAFFLTTLDAKVIVGGGDSAAAVTKWGLEKKFYHLSTGGGATLELLEFGHLPGIDAFSCP